MEKSINNKQYQLASFISPVRHLLFVELLVIAIVCCACSYHPWRAERYVNEKTEYLDVYSTVPDKGQFEEYYIENYFVKVVLKGQNETWYSGKGPYDMVIMFWEINKPAQPEQVYLKDIKIHSSQNRNYEPFPPSSFPLFPNLDKSTEPTIRRAEIHSLTPLDLNFGENEVITIELSFEIIQSNSTLLQKTISYEFKPKLEKGNFIWITT